MSRVVVIGAGVGGLACAARLAADGHEVDVFERADVVGGKLGRYERTTPEGTFRFNTGPGLLTLPQVFADLFAATGSTLADELDLVRLDPVVRHVFPDGSTLDSGTDVDTQMTLLCGPVGAGEWRRLWRRAERVWEASWRHVLTAPVTGPMSLLPLVWRLGDLSAIAPGRSLRDLSRTHLSDPRQRMLLDRYATYTGSDPRRAPAALVAIPYAEMTFGGWYVRGGLSTVGEALVRRCRALGVRLHTSAEVAAVETTGRAVAGIRLADGERIRADIVVSDVDALSLYRDLLPTRRRLGRLRARSLAGFVLLLGVRGRTGEHGGGRAGRLAHHSVFFPRDYDAEFDAIFGRPARPVPDPAIYVSVPDDPALRPEGHEAWFVLVNAPPHGPVDWRAAGLADAYADRVLDRLASRGLDVRRRILFREIRTPADLQVSTNSPGGSIYGTPMHGLLRPGNRGPVAGLYLVGGSVHPGGGLPMVALSAQIVAGLVAADLRRGRLTGAGSPGRSRPDGPGPARPGAARPRGPR